MMEIKPCPFCAGVPHIRSEYEAYSESGGKFYHVRCGSCRAETGGKYAAKGDDCQNFYAELWDEWNQRSEISPSEADKWLAEATAQRDRADKADEMVAFLKKELARVANFNCDWDMLKACQESWRELAGENNKLKKEHDQLTESLDHARRMLAYSGKLQ